MTGSAHSISMFVSVVLGSARHCVCVYCLMYFPPDGRIWAICMSLNGLDGPITANKQCAIVEVTIIFIIPKWLCVYILCALCVCVPFSVCTLSNWPFEPLTLSIHACCVHDFLCRLLAGNCCHVSRRAVDVIIGQRAHMQGSVCPRTKQVLSIPLRLSCEPETQRKCQLGQVSKVCVVTEHHIATPCDAKCFRLSIWMAQNRVISDNQRQLYLKYNKYNQINQMELCEKCVCWVHK